MQVEVVAEVDGWLHCVASNGAKGLVPSSYVRILGAGETAGFQQQSSSVVSMRPSETLAVQAVIFGICFSVVQGKQQLHLTTLYTDLALASCPHRAFSHERKGPS